MIDQRRGGFYNTWEMKTIKGHTRRVRKLYRSYNFTMVTKTRRASNNRKRRHSRNQRNMNNRRKEKFGILVPVTTRDALLSDKENNNIKWADTILKEMAA